MNCTRHGRWFGMPDVLEELDLVGVRQLVRQIPRCGSVGKIPTVSLQPYRVSKDRHTGTDK